jgi:hypothetical protein
MIGLMIARDELATGRVERMQMRAVLESLAHALRHLAGFHLVGADRFPHRWQSENTEPDFLSRDVSGREQACGERGENQEIEVSWFGFSGMGEVDAFRRFCR